MGLSSVEEKVVSLYLLEAGGQGFAGLETVVRGRPQRFGITVTSEMEAAACVLTRVLAEKRTAQLFKVKLFSSGSPSGVRTTSALSVTGSFVTVFSTVLSSEFRNWELSAWASQVAQQGSICLPMQETQLGSLGQEKGMATHSSILAREIHGQRSLTGYSPLGL